MKDGFDRSVAEKMPRMQKKRPNRPWNIDPVQLKTQEENIEPPKENAAIQEVKPVAEAIDTAREDLADKPASPPIENQKLESKMTDLTKTVETIEDISTEFSQILFNNKDVQRQLIDNQKALLDMERENNSLRESMSVIKKDENDSKVLEKEIIFLNEQLEDADFYIKNMVGILDERTSLIESEVSQRKNIESKFDRVSKEIQNKAKLDVKVSILERDLTLSQTRIFELETKLDEEYRKREPLEDEIMELKNALDRVHSSLAHIRLKAKREVYGS